MRKCCVCVLVKPSIAGGVKLNQVRQVFAPMYILVFSHCNILVIVTVVASEREREGGVGDFGKWSARCVHEPLPDLAVGRGGALPLLLHALYATGEAETRQAEPKMGI
jgi:hypothetical protein